MPDSAEQLQRLYLAGFELQTFERYPKCIGVRRENCVALLVPGVDGLQVLGTPGWRTGEVMGVLTERKGSKVFQAKTEVVETHAFRGICAVTVTSPWAPTGSSPVGALIAT